MAILELHDLASGYGEVQILWGASLALEQGKITALVGGTARARPPCCARSWDWYGCAAAA